MAVSAENEGRVSSMFIHISELSQMAQKQHRFQEDGQTVEQLCVYR
jgi:hypothetical protein